MDTVAAKRVLRINASNTEQVQQGAEEQSARTY
jgi:hypothetical protein